MRESTKGSRLIQVYDSIAEFAQDATRAIRNPSMPGRVTDNDADRNDFCAGTFQDAVELAATGWSDQLPDALAIAESAVEMADQEHMMDTFQPQWDVTGAEVDVARYLSGEPECMIDFPLSKTSKQGRVITLVASRSTSASISAETMIRHGQVAVALALALARLGHAVEIWADIRLSSQNRQGTAPEGEVIVKVKDVNDELDPAAVLFALAHPGFYRRLGFAVIYDLPVRRGKTRRSVSTITAIPKRPDP